MLLQHNEMPHPPKKKAMPTSRKRPASEEQDYNNEQIFTACHILCGNLDRQLCNGDGAPVEVRRGRLVLTLLDDDEYEGENGFHGGKWEILLGATRSSVRLVRSSKLQDQLHHLLHGDHETLGSKNITELFRGPILSSARICIANCLIDQALGVVDDIESAQRLNSAAIHHIVKALQFWPCNPAALLSFANLQRMGKLKNMKEKNETDEMRLLQALDCYLAAAACAHLSRRIALDMLMRDETATDDKFLVESILLESAKVQELEDGSYGESEFLVTASAMSALLASMVGKHKTARNVLLRFSSLSQPITRIHPNVWDAAKAAARGVTDVDSSDIKSMLTPSQAAFKPRVFPRTCPDDLFDILRHAFRPDAPYWQQSGYDRNIYYSFWTDWPLPRANIGGTANEAIRAGDSFLVSNAVEHYIVEHLLPRIKIISPGHDLLELKGFEWWVHSRPSNGANLGHQLHFDTDEALLEQDGRVEFPISASVTYLNEADEGNQEGDADEDDGHSIPCPYGATILFDQTPSTSQNAGMAWLNIPKSKSFLIFPGDLLHGVMPCMTYSSPDLSNESGSPCSQRTLGCDELPPPHRLTLMVNFWAYRIPDRLKQQKLYGASSPFPPMTRRHSWTQDIMIGYPRTVSFVNDYSATSAFIPSSIDDDSTSLIPVSPAWDELRAVDDINEGKKNTIEYDEWMFPCSELQDSLAIPPSGSGINQRFFVPNDPSFFKLTLQEC